MSRLRPSIVLLVLAATAIALGGAPVEGDARESEGSERRSAPTDEPKTIRAAFAERSYAPGDRADLRIWAPVRRVTLQVFQAGPEARPSTGRNDVLTGVPVTAKRTVGLVESSRVRLAVGPWRSGMYYARLIAPGGYLGFAPVVIRPRALGSSRVAVVVPTNTWQAYNFRDVDGNGVGDTWYADPRIPCVDLSRAYLDRGVPSMRFRGFLRWFEHGRRRADFLSDEDLHRIGSGAKLWRLYDLVLFASHEEYVTTEVYDMVRRYRDLGGNLAFLSANSFFYRVEYRGHHLCRTGLWAGLGRVDAELTGVHYIGWWENRYPSRPYVARGVHRAPWLFRGTGLRNGDTIAGRFGVEIDSVTRDSPAGTLVLADIRNIFGPGRTATMTYYRTRAGAKVFAAGAFGFEVPHSPVHKALLDNLWAYLARA